MLIRPNLLTASVSIVFLGLMATNATQAAVIYNQSLIPDNNLVSSQTDDYGNLATAYDNFSLSTSTGVTGVQWQGGYFNEGDLAIPPTPPITDFTISFYGDNAGQPGTLLYSESLTGDANEISLSVPDAFVYSYSVDLSTAFMATAGTEYWLSIVPFLVSPPQWGVSRGSGGDSYSYQTFLDEPIEYNYDLAFSLTDARAEVPAPATLALLGLGLVGIGWSRRKKV